MLFNFSLVLSPTAKILSSGLTLHIHLTILGSFLSSLITSFLNGQVSLPYNITLRTLAEYNLPLAPNGKPLLVKKGIKSLNLHHPLLILVIALSNAPLLAPIVSTKIAKPFPQFQETGHLILCLDNTLLCLSPDLHISNI